MSGIDGRLVVSKLGIGGKASVTVELVDVLSVMMILVVLDGCSRSQYWIVFVAQNELQYSIRTCCGTRGGIIWLASFVFSWLTRHS
jgi:hypothetical protein